MKSTQDLYISVLKEEITPSEFLYQVRKDNRFKQYITPLQSYDDTVNTLKAKGFINEIFVQDEDEIDPEEKYGGNTAWKAMDRLNKGKGDDLDDSILKTYSGLADDALDPRRSFSLNEEGTEDYTKAFNSIIEKLQQDSGNDAQEVSHMIDIAVAEFDLNEEEEKKLRIDVFDWRNQDSGNSYEDEINESDPDDEEESLEDYEGTGMDENYLPGGVGDKTSPNSVDRKQLELGINIEMEHTNDPKVAEEIALDHLTEDPKYYSKLNKSHLQETTRSHHPLDLRKQFPQFDNLRWNQLFNGARYEYEESNKKNWLKSYEKSGNNLLKDPLYYVNKINNIKSVKNRTDLPVEVKNNSLVDKKNASTVVKGSDKHPQSRPKKVAKTPRVKKQKITLMTHKPKKAKGVKVMALPGKEKKVKLSESKLKLISQLIKEEVDSYIKKKLNELTPSSADAMKNVAKALAGSYKKDEIVDYIIALRNGDEKIYDSLKKNYPQNQNDIDVLYKVSLNEKKNEINEDHLDDKEQRIQYILQHKDVIRQNVSYEYLDSLTNNYIEKLYLAVEKKVKENEDLGDQEIEYSSLDEDILTEDEIKLQEVKGLDIKPGAKFDMQGDLGKFKKGENVTVTNVDIQGQDVNFTLRNDQGIEDTFTMDINDKFDDEI